MDSTIKTADHHSLDGSERRWLLVLARTTLEARLANRPLPDQTPKPGPLTQPRGAFVTLTADGRLRGCIGHVAGREPLWLSVRSNAINAAFHDPRFPPLENDEMIGITIEISALSPLLDIDGPEDVLIGRDGLIVERGSSRGLLLPQVATGYGWTREEFLDQTCRKAGLEPGSWRSPRTRLRSFSAEVFAEDEPDRARAR
jgi:AmmeMemoRadiSam system protein A